MALELIFEKDEGASWGFRLTGGAEYDVPLTVVKVLENSIAERGGLQVNDIIVRVNETATAGLTHPEAHDVLLAAGNYLVLAIRRGEACSFVPQEEESNAEVCNVMQQSLGNQEECVQSDSKMVHFDLANVVEEKSSAESNVIQTKHISAEKEIEISVSTETSQQVEERKWSTFLQRPKNPKPVKIEDDTLKAPPYRVVIVKQKKKSPEEKKQIISSENILDESRVESIEISQETNITEEGEEITYRAEITQEEEIEVEVENDESTEIEVQEEEICENLEETVEEEEVMDQSIEEKLAEVQRQLAALSHLPSTIQSTINAVTQQLASIVSVKKPPPPEEDTVSETHSNPENDFTEQILTEGSISGNEEIAEEEETQEPEPQLEEQEEEILAEPEETEEEKEAKRIEQELFVKQQKEFEEFKQRHIEQRPLKPIDRPIILPGGRRWSQPDDACPAVRHPKMSDEKIANTIETFSEVLVGKAKGLTIGTLFGHGLTTKSPSTVGIMLTFLLFCVLYRSVESRFGLFCWSNCFMVPSKAIATGKINFLKYQPPPKNLDYLQRSEVYRLVHDLEPPVRGISSRACKILAEQDYYQGEEEV